MRTTARWIAVALAIIVLAGCKSQSVTRTYKANMDDTWDAVLAVAAKVSKDAPKADREARRIVTGTVSSAPRDVSSVGTMWRGIITLSPDLGGTKVAIKVEKLAGQSTVNDPGSQEKPASLGITLWSSNTDWQKKLLDEIAAVLAAKSPVTSHQ